MFDLYTNINYSITRFNFWRYKQKLLLIIELDN